MEELSLEALRERFQHYDIRLQPQKYHLDYPAGVFRKASVLIPLFYRDGDYRVILTVRSKDLTHHAGYVAFPGGMKDEEDKDEIQTALREAEEEIGLDPNTVDIICVSCPVVTHPNTLAYPVIALVQPDFHTRRNEQEVAMLFDLPMSRFLSSIDMHVKSFTYPSKSVAYHAHHFMDTINDEAIDTWGFTSTFCIYTALVLYQSDKTFNIINDIEITKDNAFSTVMTNIMISDFIKKKANL